MANTFEKIAVIFANQFGYDVSAITPETDIQNDLGADSLDIAEMLITVEEEFNIIIGESELLELKNIADVVKHIDAKKARLSSISAICVNCINLIDIDDTPSCIFRDSHDGYAIDGVVVCDMYSPKNV
jgi:acyl carrier protein